MNPELYAIPVLLSIAAGGAAYGVSLRLRSRRALAPRVADRVFYGLTLLYTLTFAALSVLRHLTFNTGGYDLGIFDQVVWNSLHGRLFENTILPDAPMLIGQRFSPILAAFVPLYALWSNPIVLLVVQAIGMGIAAFPIYWFARRQIGGGLALVVVLAYYLSPALEFTNLFQFHETALLVPLFSFAVFFLLRHHTAGLLATLVLALMTKEEAAFTVSAFGVVLFLFYRKRRLGGALALGGLLWALFLLQFLLPLLRGLEFGNYYYFSGGEGAGGGPRYAYLGRSFLEVITTILTRPDIVLAHLLVPAKFEFVLDLLVPLAFVSLIGIEAFVLAFPAFAISLLSDYAPQFSIRYHYAAPLIPFLFFGVALGIARWQRWSNRVSANAQRACLFASSAIILASSVSSYWLLAPGPLARNFDPQYYRLDAHTARGGELVRTIPFDATVVAQTELAAHLSQRVRIYEFPVIADYRQAEYLIADTTRFWYGFHQGAWERWLASEYFEISTRNDGYFIARRRAPAQLLNLRFGDQLTLLGYTIPTTITLRGGMTIRPILDWRAERVLTERYIVQAHLLDVRGHLWARDDREPQDGNLPTTEWIAGERVGDQYALALPSTMPPGEYRLVLSVCAAQENCLRARNPGGEDAGVAPIVAAVRIEKDKSSIIASQLPIEIPFFVDMGEMRLLGYAELPHQVSAGETLALGVYWRAREKPRGDYEIAVQLRDAANRVVLENSARPAAGAYPTTEWSAGEVLLDWHALALPADLPQGEYKLIVVLRTVSQSLIGETLVTTIAVEKKK